MNHYVLNILVLCHFYDLYSNHSPYSFYVYVSVFYIVIDVSDDSNRINMAVIREDYFSVFRYSFIVNINFVYYIDSQVNYRNVLRYI